MNSLFVRLVVVWLVILAGLSEFANGISQQKVELEAAKTWESSSELVVFKSEISVVPGSRLFLSVDFESKMTTSANRPENSFDVNMSVLANKQTSQSNLRSSSVGEVALSNFICTIVQGSKISECVYMLDLYISQLRIDTTTPILLALEASCVDKAVQSIADYGMQFTVKATVVSLSSPLQPWMKTAIPSSAVQCTIQNLVEKVPNLSSKLGILDVSNNGQSIKITRQHSTATGLDPLDLLRMTTLELGFQQAIVFAMAAWKLDKFPSFKAAVVLSVQSSASVLSQSLEETSKLCQVSVPVFSPFAPSSSEAVIPIPDPSYFAPEIDTKDDTWFGIVEQERQVTSGTIETAFSLYERSPFLSKFQAVGYRSIGYLASVEVDDSWQQSLQTCKMASRLDARPDLLTLESLCGRYQAILVSPDKYGVWPWAAKYALLCNSVTILVAPEDIGGNQWETRLEIGLQPWVHYLPLKVRNGNDLCTEVQKLMDWIATNQERAQTMAYRSRALILQKLHQDSVLYDLGYLLLDYAMLGRSNSQKSSVVRSTPITAGFEAQKLQPAVIVSRQITRFKESHVDWTSPLSLEALRNSSNTIPEPLDRPQPAMTEEEYSHYIVPKEDKGDDVPDPSKRYQTTIRARLYDVAGNKPWLLPPSHRGKQQQQQKQSPLQPQQQSPETSSRPESKSQSNLPWVMRPSETKANSESGTTATKSYINPYRTRRHRNDRRHR